MVIPSTSDTVVAAVVKDFDDTLLIYSKYYFKFLPLPLNFVSFIGLSAI